MAKYTLHAGQDSAEFSRKEAAVKAGDATGGSYTVYSPSGKIVHEVNVADKIVIEAEEASTKKFDLAKMRTKIEKLLRKAEGTDSEEERNAFNEAAERLMLKLGIERAELESDGEVKAEDIVEQKIFFEDNYSSAKVGFVHAVAQGFGHLTVLQTTRRVKPYRIVHVIGHKTDVKLFTILINSMLMQATSGLHGFQRENAEDRQGMTDWERYVQNRTFLGGFAEEVRRRLEELRRISEGGTTTGAELVLVNKQERINDWVAEQFGELTKSRGGNKNFDAMGYIGGREAGSKAALGGEQITK